MIRRRLYFAIAPLLWRKKPMPANRCTVCSTNYPVSHKYVKCMVCGADCKYSLTETAMHPDKLAELKREYLPPDDDAVKKLRIDAEHRFETFYLYAVAEAARRNEIADRWTPEDILEELLDHQAEDLAA